LMTKHEEDVLLKEENINHLEMLRNNLEESLSAKTSACEEKVLQYDELTERMTVAQNKAEELTKTNLRLKANLDLRATEVHRLHSHKSSLEKEVESAKEKVEDAMEAKNDLEKLRKNEMKMCENLQRKLAETERKSEEVESARRSMEAQQRLLMEAEGRVDEKDGLLIEWQKKMEEVEMVMQDMEQRMDQLKEEAEYYKAQHEALTELTEPFKDQLEAFEAEKKAILGQKESAVGEMERLSSSYASLLGHQNSRQKIHHVIKLKEEKNQLMKEVAELRENLMKSRKSYTRLEEKFHEAQGIKRFDPRMSFQPKSEKVTPLGKNKENSRSSSSMLPLETPVSSKLSGRQPRSATRSPLNPVNRK